MPNADETSIVLAALPLIAPDAPTACSGWNAHRLRAHLARCAWEGAERLGGKLAGRSEPPSEKPDEEPFVTLTDRELRVTLLRQVRMLRALTDRLTAVDNTARVPFSGAMFTATQLRTHLDSEAAVHCWDLLGDDGRNDRVLARPELTRHAVTVLNTMPWLCVAPVSHAARAGFRRGKLVLRSPGHLDVLSTPDGVCFTTSLGEVDAVVSTDPGTRLLMLWGRLPQSREIAVSGDMDVATRVLP